jgi:dipeptidase
MSAVRIFSVLFILFALSLPGFGCTIFGVTKNASENNESVFVGHTNDGFGPGDVGGIIREDMVTFKYVPAQNHSLGSIRPIPYDPNSGGEFYDTSSAPSGNQTILGYIDQVPHTYGYLTGSYGMINEHQLMSGECTDFAKIHPDAEKGKKIFYSSELSNIVMERCKTAREAVNLTGYLIDNFGYYGTGETLIYGDPSVVWVIEMCGGNQSDKGYWIAQKVPEGEVFVAANEFRIREIDPENKTQLFSKNLARDAVSKGWWNNSTDGQLDWAQAYGAGEYSHPYYSLDRVWRVFDRIAPSQNLSPYVEGPFTKKYTFSVPPDKPINITEAFALFRDHYEGIKGLDLTEQPAGGPFGNPYRNWGPYDKHDQLYPGELKPGAWARPLSTDPCGYSYVAQARDWLSDPIGGVCWLGLSSPSETCYAPFYAGILGIPAAYQNGSHWEFDMNVAFWPFEMVQNWARLMYSEMIPSIKAEQARLEGAAVSRQSKIEAEAIERQTKNVTDARQFLTEYTNKTSMENLESWRRLLETLIVTYRNGQYNDIENKTISNIGYPDWWLENSGYQYGPRVYDLKSLQEIPNVLLANKTINVTLGNMIEYIRKNQTRNLTN